MKKYGKEIGWKEGRDGGSVQDDYSVGWGIGTGEGAEQGDWITAENTKGIGFGEGGADRISRGGFFGGGRGGSRKSEN